jgi:hypothetical protein
MLNQPDSNLEQITETFKLPIFYVSDKPHTISPTIAQDLELSTTIDAEETPIYSHVFDPTSHLGKIMIKKIPEMFTTNIRYLKETQQSLENLDLAIINSIYNKYNISDLDVDSTALAWEEIRKENGFCEKYLYLDWSFLKHLNNHPTFLQAMSIYNITSPLLSLLLPIIVLILPFFIIKLQGKSLSSQQYITILKKIIENHAITKLFTQFNTADFSQKIYLVVSVAFYIFSIYQNVLTCIRFYNNMKKIHTYLEQFKTYVKFTIDYMNYYISLTTGFTEYQNFIEDLKKQIKVLQIFESDLNKVTKFHFSLHKTVEIGHVMYTFYQIYSNKEYNEALKYSFGFNGYMHLLTNFKDNILGKKLNACKFIDEKEEKSKKGKKTKKGKKNIDLKPKFKNMYYPKFINDPNIVKNDCNLNKNLIITGPNASGKTTILKTCLTNILLSQQFGYGCYDSLSFVPYNHIHCYLNIPDTSGRDSLFQAEARRGKEIIDSIKSFSEDNHFCIFDELYSGTNPEEAVTSGTAFMNYLFKKSNVTCLLTTHYLQLCKNLESSKQSINMSMQTKINDENEHLNKITYTYKLVQGISTVKGGLQILQNMDYPQEILDNTKL